MSKGEEKILLSHGNGGRMMHQLIEELFLRHFQNPILLNRRMLQYSRLTITEMAFTTDSFVIDPLFFPGETSVNCLFAEL